MAEDYPKLKSPKPDGEKMRRQVEAAMDAYERGDRSDKVLLIRHFYLARGGQSSGGCYPG